MSKTKSTNKSVSNNYKTPTYRRITDHVYAVSDSKGRNRYRVRMSINNVKYDEYFTNKSVALKYRKDLLNTRG